MNNFWKTLLGYLNTIVTYLQRPPVPTAPITVTPSTPAIVPPGVPPSVPLPPKIDVHATLTAYIESQTFSVGPMPGTGGVIHKVSNATADSVAAKIIATAGKYGLDVSQPTALIRIESDFDAAADDPNNQDAKPGETPEQAAAHSDLGIEQEDVAVAEGDVQFKGKTLAYIEAKLLDVDYGIDYVCKTLATNNAWAIAAFASDPSLSIKVPDEDWLVLSFQAYNSGPHGALNKAHNDGVKGNWSYGLSGVKHYDDIAKIIGA